MTVLAVHSALINRRRYRRRQAKVRPFYDGVRFFPSGEVYLRPIGPRYFTYLFHFGRCAFKGVGFSLLKKNVGKNQVVGRIQCPFSRLLLTPTRRITRRERDYLRESIVHRGARRSDLRQIGGDVPIPKTINVYPHAKRWYSPIGVVSRVVVEIRRVCFVRFQCFRLIFL